MSTATVEVRGLLATSPELAAISMWGSSLLVAANALLLKRKAIQGRK